MAPSPPFNWEDYQKIINGEGILSSDLAQLTGEDQAQRAGLRSTLGSLFGDYGAVPAGYQDSLGVLTPEVRDMAGRNQFSILNQLDRKRKQARGGLRARLAARGAMVSGENALGEGEIGYQHGLANYGALRDLMQQVGSAESGYANDVRDRFGRQATAYQDATGRLLDSGFRPPAASGRIPGAAGGTAAVPVGQVDPRSGFTVAPPSNTGDPAQDAQRSQIMAANGQINLGNEQARMEAWWKKKKPAVGKDAQFIRNQQATRKAAGDSRWWV